MAESNRPDPDNLPPETPGEPINYRIQRAQDFLEESARIERQRRVRELLDRIYDAPSAPTEEIKSNDAHS